MEAFLLGISTGWYCLSSCGMYLIPFLFGEETDNKQNILLVLLFLCGRLAIYLILGIISGFIGYLFTENGLLLSTKISSFLNLIVGLILLCGGIFRSFSSIKFCHAIKQFYNPKLNVFLFGIFAGLSVCPPLVAAIAGAFQSHSLFLGLQYFLFFYFGTTVYFLPLFGIKLLPDKTVALQCTARIVMVIMGLYFLERAVIGFFC